MGAPSQTVIDVSLLHQAVEIQARQRPDHIAIDDGTRQMTYAELCRRMESVAASLIAHGVKRGSRVGILADNGIEAYVAILGALRADACFVPLNPGFPALRLADILDQAEADAVITLNSHVALLRETLQAQTGKPVAAVLLADAEPPAEQLTGAPVTVGQATLEAADGSQLGPSRNIEEDLAYILFTSGTTGRPKGVMVPHRGVRSIVRWGIDYFAIQPRDRLSNHSRLSFDVSLFDIFTAFYAGATLCPLTAAGDLAFPGEFIRRQRITIWFSVPSVIGMMLRSGQLAGGAFPSLRAALFAGEALAPDWVAGWREHQPQVPIFNLYGPTEASIVVTVHAVGVDSPFEPGKPVPIGRATRDTELLILKPDADEEVAPGEVGRLMICGIQLACGYWRRPDLTASAFRPNPLKRDSGALMYDTGDLASRDAGGLIYFLGRSDDQVKVQGYRIELSEIEITLRSAAGVHSAAVVAVGRNPTRLVGFVVPRNAESGDLEEAALQHLESRLPYYMIPKRILIVADLPYTDHGKVNRQALAASATRELDRPG